MVSIPGGIFWMGTDDAEIERLVKKFDWDGYRREKPQHQVTVPPFSMGKYPVTQAQWKAIAALDKIDIDLELDPSNFKGDQRPVETVNWYECVEFCKRLSQRTGKQYRLPSEAQWEYACRSVNSEQLTVNSEGLTLAQWNEKYHQPFHFGQTITGDLANYRATYTFADEPKGQYRKETTSVGQFPPNAFGLYDMHGNVWEWCADEWHKNYQNAPSDGSIWLNGDNNRSPLRGGSWNYNPFNCRSAYRNSFDAREDRNYLNGCRVVCVFGSE